MGIPGLRTTDALTGPEQTEEWGFRGYGLRTPWQGRNRPSVLRIPIPFRRGTWSPGERKNVQDRYNNLKKRKSRYYLLQILATPNLF